MRLRLAEKQKPVCKKRRIFNIKAKTTSIECISTWERYGIIQNPYELLKKKEYCKVTPKLHVLADSKKKCFMQEDKKLSSPTTVTNLLKTYLSLKKYDTINN